jgi:hypothetical protein
VRWGKVFLIYIAYLTCDCDLAVRGMEIYAAMNKHDLLAK